VFHDSNGGIRRRSTDGLTHQSTNQHPDTGVPYAPNSASLAGSAPAGQRAAKRPLRWAIFTPPKPFSKAPHQLVALRSWLSLRVPPQVFLVEAADLDPLELRQLEAE